MVVRSRTTLAAAAAACIGAAAGRLDEPLAKNEPPRVSRGAGGWWRCGWCRAGARCC